MKIDPAAVRALRERRAWSQEQLAEVAGLSVRTVQRVETGGGASLDTRMALAAALEVTPAELCMEDPDAPRAAESASDTAPGTPPADQEFRTAIIVVGVAIVFLLSLLVGFLVGRDFADKADRQDCIAAGRTDCR